MCFFMLNSKTVSSQANIRNHSIVVFLSPKTMKLSIQHLPLVWQHSKVRMFISTIKMEIQAPGCKKRGLIQASGRSMHRILKPTTVHSMMRLESPAKLVERLELLKLQVHKSTSNTRLHSIWWQATSFMETVRIVAHTPLLLDSHLRSSSTRPRS